MLFQKFIYPAALLPVTLTNARSAVAVWDGKVSQPHIGLLSYHTCAAHLFVIELYNTKQCMQNTKAPVV